MSDGPAQPAQAAPLDEPSKPQALCPSQQVPERGRAWGWDVLAQGRPVRAFALRFDGTVRAYLNRCVHVPTEMDWQPGEFLGLDKRWILCSTHGASYEPADGRCVAGPCGRGRLTPVVVAEQDGQVYWYPSPDIRPVPLDAPADESPP